jgi:hypothetical protein
MKGWATITRLRHLFAKPHSNIWNMASWPTHAGAPDLDVICDILIRPLEVLSNIQEMAFL